MIGEFLQYNYCFWDVDLNSFDDTHGMLNKILNHPTLYYDNDAPEESIGNAYSLFDLEKFEGFDDLVAFVEPTINKYLTILGKPINKKIVRAWCNAMHKNSSGAIHKHAENCMVFILYCEVPADSGNLVLIDAKHGQKNRLLSEENVPEFAKKYISVHKGLCILHDSNLWHAVSKNNSESIRKVIVIEFNCN